MEHLCELSLLNNMCGYVIQHKDKDLTLVIKGRKKDIELIIDYCPVCGFKTPKRDINVNHIASDPYDVPYEKSKKLDIRYLKKWVHLGKHAFNKKYEKQFIKEAYTFTPEDIELISKHLNESGLTQEEREIAFKFVKERHEQSNL